jgi:iron(III) transport system permease protein
MAIVLGYAAGFSALVSAGLGLGSALVDLVREARRDIWITLGDAFVASILALGPSAVIGWNLAVSRRSRPVRGLLWIGVLVPLALPPALVGIGIAEALASWAPSGLRTSTLIPIFADLARFSPFAVLAVYAFVRRVDPLLIEAAQLLRPSGPARWWRIEGPLAAPGLVAAFVVVFCGSVGELEATLMSAAPGAGVLSMRVFNYLHYGASDTVAALGLVLGAVLWSAGAVSFRVVPRLMAGSA